MERKTIREQIEKFSVYDLDGDLEDAILFLQKKQRLYGENVVIDVDPGDYYDISDTCIRLYRDRLETDNEFEKRIAEDEKVRARKQARQAKKEELERELYQKLKEKYESQ